MPVSKDDRDAYELGRGQRAESNWISDIVEALSGDPVRRSVPESQRDAYDRGKDGKQLDE
jgi:hypothetical protein